VDEMRKGAAKGVAHFQDGAKGAEHLHQDAKDVAHFEAVVDSLPDHAAR
jgi:hypothetical protein